MLYELRPATAQDYLWCKTIGHEGLRPYIEQIRGWHQTAEDEGFKQHWNEADIKIISYHGNNAGYLKLERYPDHLYLDGLYLASDFRSKGLGQQVLVDLLAAESLPIRLTVFRNNPAQRLYKRLGFIVVEETGHSLKMEYS